MFISKNRALLTFWLKVFVQNSTLLGVVYTKSVRQSGKMSYVSAQSWKSSFHKRQIFDCAYSALPQCFFLFRFKNHYCIELYIWKPLKNEKRLVAHHYSLREARFPKYRFLNLHIPHFCSFIPYLGWNHRCIKLSIWKALKKWKRLVASRYSLQSPCFAKYRFLNLHILHFPCFIPCLGYRTEELDCCDTGYVHFSTWLFILFRFVSQNTVSLLE